MKIKKKYCNLKRKLIFLFILYLKSFKKRLFFGLLLLQRYLKLYYILPQLKTEFKVPFYANLFLTAVHLNHFIFIKEITVE